MKKAVSLILVGLILILPTSCAKKPKADTLTFTAMNTVMDITVFSTSKGTNEEFLEEVRSCIEKTEKLFDANNPNSDVSLINNSKSNSINISSETSKIIDKSIEASRLTNGAFDITVMPVLKLWGFNDGKYGVPKKADILNAKKLVGYENISVKSNTFTKTTGTEIALGGIAKGYLGDSLLKLAKEYGAVCIFSLGGNIALAGQKSNGSLWSVGIKNPDDDSTISCSFKCEGENSVVTSGAYERYFEYGGKKYHHIIDTKTGAPAKSDLKSVTVIGKDGAFCDAFSTALYVMGKEKATEFALEHSDFDFILITDKNEILATKGVKEIDVKLKDFTVKSIEK